MKLTSDFVTNSSSANFIIARKGKLSKNQIQKLIKRIESKFLGEIVLKHDATEEEIQNFLDDSYLTEKQEQMIRDELKDGKDIYKGTVSFEEAEYHIEAIYENIWDSLDDEDNINIIKGDLDY